MKKELKDYLHLYLGCDCQTPDGIGKLIGRVATSFDIATIRFDDWKKLKPISGANRKDFGKSNNYEIADIKPILRRLDSMTEDEEKALYKAAGNPEYAWQKRRIKQCLPGRPEGWRHLLSKGFDLFGLIEEGLAIDAATLNHES